MSDEWNSLDAAAEANLGHQHMPAFRQYKARLRADGCAWKNDAEMSLTGYIWDVLEMRLSDEIDAEEIA